MSTQLKAYTGINIYNKQHQTVKIVFLRTTFLDYNEPEAIVTVI